MEIIEENKMFDYSGCLAPPTTAATEPVFGCRENIDGNDHFSTGPDLVPRTQVELASKNDYEKERYSERLYSAQYSIRQSQRTFYYNIYKFHLCTPGSLLDSITYTKYVYSERWAWW
jgi:hypothetical protein